MTTTILTYKYRIKDSSCKKKLQALSGSVNYVWNYINDLSYQNIKQRSRFLSYYDVCRYLNGAAAELNLHSFTLREVARTYTENRQTFKKNKLAWRSAKKKSLGWIPFQAKAIKLIGNDTVKYGVNIFRYYASRPLPEGAVIKTGSFVQDSRDRWYVNITFNIPKNEIHPILNSSIGIDLGVKTNIALSNGQVFQRENLTKKYEEKLAAAQRANKKKQVRNIHAKIANCRKDWAHKTTTIIAKQFANIYVGDLQTSKLISADKPANINKAVSDSGIYQIKTFLKYKAGRLGGTYNAVNEAYTTQQCNICKELTGPKGPEELCVREWKCVACNADHNRDVNSAINILRIGHYTPKGKTDDNIRREDVNLSSSDLNING